MSIRTVFVLLVALLLIGCSSLATFSVGADGENHQSGAGPNFACEQVLQHLNMAKHMVSQIRGFNWAEFAAIGVVLPPPGICATGTTYLAEKDSVPSGLGWVPLTEKLAFGTADNFAVVCDNCLALAKEVCSSGKKLSSDDEQELWCQLESALTGAIYSVSTHKNVVAYQIIPETESQFGRSSDDIREKYDGKFRARCDQYFALLDGLLHHLEEAKQSVLTLCGE